MNHQQLRSWPPRTGSYHAGRDHDAGEGRVDAVAIASLRTAVGPLHLRLPVTAASLVIKRKLPTSWLEVDFDSSAVRSSAPLPLRRSVNARVAQAMDAVRLETFALEEVAAGRLRGHADLFAAGGATQVRLEINVVDVAASGLRVAVRSRVPRAALGLDTLGRLGGPWARLVIALHATSDVRTPSMTGAVA